MGGRTLVATTGLEGRFSADGNRPSCASPQSMTAIPSCLRLLMHLMSAPLAFARASEGNKREARIAIMAITTNNSIRVKARRRSGENHFIAVINILADRHRRRALCRHVLFVLQCGGSAQHADRVCCF